MTITKCCFLCKLSAPLYQWTQAGKMLIHCKKINKIEEEKEDCKMFDEVILETYKNKQTTSKEKSYGY